MEQGSVVVNSVVAMPLLPGGLEDDQPLFLSGTPSLHLKLAVNAILKSLQKIWGEAEVCTVFLNAWCNAFLHQPLSVSLSLNH